MEELLQREAAKKHEQEQEQKRLKEKVLCVEIKLPVRTQSALGISGFTMKLSELADFLDNDYSNDERGVYTIKVMKRTNKWIENLPEADI